MTLVSDQQITNLIEITQTNDHSVTSYRSATVGLGGRAVNVVMLFYQQNIILVN